MKIGSFITILLSLLVTVFAVIVTALGWSRILFYTGWMAKSLAYPVSILFYIAFMILALSRVGTFARAAKASVVAGLITFLFWMVISAFDQYNNGPIVAYMSAWFGMHSVIVEEQELNIIAVLGGVVWPVLYSAALFFVIGVMGPQKLSYRKL